MPANRCAVAWANYRDFPQYYILFVLDEGEVVKAAAELSCLNVSGRFLASPALQDLAASRQHH